MYFKAMKKISFLYWLYNNNTAAAVVLVAARRLAVPSISNSAAPLTKGCYTPISELEAGLHFLIMHASICHYYHSLYKYAKMNVYCRLFFYVQSGRTG